MTTIERELRQLEKLEELGENIDRLVVERNDLREGLRWMLDNWTSPALRAADIDRLRALVEKS